MMCMFTYVLHYTNVCLFMFQVLWTGQVDETEYLLNIC